MATSSDPDIRAQDVKRCQLCLGKDRKSAAETVCNTCHVNLCKDCVGHHMISNPTIRHDVVTFEFKKSEIIPPQCRVHQEKKCEMFCQQCNSPICQKCLASGSHENHTVPQISEMYSSQQELIRKDLDELETSIAPVFESILSETGAMSSSIEQKHGERQQTISELGEKCHKIVDKVIKKYQSDSRKMEREDINSIQSLQSEFQKLHSLIQSAIVENQSILASNDSSKLVNYWSKNEQFRNVPPRFELTVPHFKPKELAEQALCQIIGNIPKTMKTIIERQVLKAPEPVPSSEKPIKEFLDLPLVVGIINTGENTSKVACIPNTDQFYIGGNSEIIKHMNTEGKVLEEITTKTTKTVFDPSDLTATREGHLVYSDKNDNSINIVKRGKLECLIRLQDWKPDAICSTLSDDLLVYMRSIFFITLDTIIHNRKVARYSGSTVTQEIHLSGMTSDLFLQSLQSYVHSIHENRNLDIVVSDPKSVLVLNNKGQFRFSYDGNSLPKKYKSFTPRGVTTDSMCHILIADSDNNIIHIIDQNGQFLMYIDNCELHQPHSLSTDSNDILFVAEAESKKLKQLRYVE